VKGVILVCSVSLDELKKRLVLRGQELGMSGISSKWDIWYRNGILSTCVSVWMSLVLNETIVTVSANRRIY